MTLIDAKFDADLINISEVTSRKIKWPRFFGLPCRGMCRKCILVCVKINEFGLCFKKIYEHFMLQTST